MPKEMENDLRQTALKRGYGKERTNAYIYGTMNKRGLLKKKGQKKALDSMGGR